MAACAAMHEGFPGEDQPILADPSPAWVDDPDPACESECAAQLAADLDPCSAEDDPCPCKIAAQTAYNACVRGCASPAPAIPAGDDPVSR